MIAEQDEEITEDKTKPDSDSNADKDKKRTEMNEDPFSLEVNLWASEAIMEEAASRDSGAEQPQKQRSRPRAHPSPSDSSHGERVHSGEQSKSGKT